MKKHLFAAASAAFFVSAAHAQFKPQGGMSLESKVAGVQMFNADGSLAIPVKGSIANAAMSQTMTGGQAATQIGANQTAISGEVSRATAAEQLLMPLSQVQTGSGMVPRLDGNLNSTANVRAAQGQFGTSNGGAAYPSLYAGFDMSQVLGSPLVGNHHVMIGGAPLAQSSADPAGPFAAMPQNLQVNGSTDGPFSNGAALAIFTAATTQNANLAEIGGNNYLSGYVPNSFDATGIFEDDGQVSARLIVTAASYTSTSVTLSRQLTATELLRIRPGQYIATNSLAVGTTSAIEAPTFLAGIVQSVNTSGSATVINVYAWNVLGGSGTSQTPSMTSFDTLYFPNYTQPTIFIGAPTQMYGGNTIMAYDGCAGGAGSCQPTSLVHSMQWWEVDPNISNETRPGMVSFHGLTFGGSQSMPAGATIPMSKVFTPDSWDAFFGGATPHHIEVGDGCGTMAFESSGYYLPAKCNLFDQAANANGIQDADIAEWNAVTQHNSAVYQWQIAMHLESNGLQNDYTDATLHFGPRINGTPGQPLAPGASLLGELQFSGLNGGVAICGYGVNCGYQMDGSGNVTFSQQATFTGQTNLKGLTILPDQMYIQNSSGTNQVSIATGSDGSLSVNSLIGGAEFIENMPLSVNAALTVGQQATFNAPFVEASGAQYFQAPAGTNIAEWLWDSAGDMRLHPLVGGGTFSVELPASFTEGVNSGGNVTVAPGKSVAYQYSNGTTYMTGDQYGNLQVIPGSAGAGGGLISEGYNFNALPSSANAGTRLYCFNCYSSANSAKTLGIPVWWNGSAWTDALGAGVQH